MKNAEEGDKKNMSLCIALDNESLKENLDLVLALRSCNETIWFKVGLRTYIKEGKKILEVIKDINQNFKIFLDLKLHDIPNTMADAAEEICNLGTVDMFNIHASAGKVAMKTVMDRIKDIPNKPLVIAVTALTSFTEDEFDEIYSSTILTKATEFAEWAYESGLDGVVSSAHESLCIKEETSADFITVCPGIRPFDEDSGDQKRVANIPFAKEQECDFIVVGRPIYKSDNQLGVVEKILEKIKNS